MKQFIEFKDEYATTLFSWFANQAELNQWAGPGLCFAQDHTLLLERLSESPNASLIHSFGLLDGDELIAFGQFYLRKECAHLCRLVVSPSRRGEGLVRELIDNLLETAKSGLSISKASLFVYPDNIPAIAAYAKLGFNEVEYPGDDLVEDCLYMQRTIAITD